MAENERDKKEKLINELDSLRYTLNSGHEFQQDIPTLNEPYPTPNPVPSEQCDLFKSGDGIIRDTDLDVPILTDVYEEQEHEAETNHTENTNVSELMNSSEPAEPVELCESSDLETTRATSPPFTETPQPEPEIPTDIEQLSDETGSSVIELEKILDELVAEQLPKLEQQLRQKLRSELWPDIDTDEKINRG